VNVEDYCAPSAPFMTTCRTAQRNQLFWINIGHLAMVIENYHDSPVPRSGECNLEQRLRHRQLFCPDVAWKRNSTWHRSSMLIVKLPAPCQVGRRGLRGARDVSTRPSASRPCIEVTSVDQCRSTAKRLTPATGSCAEGTSMSHRSPTCD
jgi:hypothetical protein